MDITILGSLVGNGTTNTTTGASNTVQVSPGAAVSSVKASSSASASGAPTAEQVRQAVESINASLQENGFSRNVQFAVDPTSKRVVVQVIEPQTNKVIRQIPSEEIIQMSMVIGQKLGQVINQQA